MKITRDNVSFGLNQHAEREGLLVGQPTRRSRFVRKFKEAVFLVFILALTAIVYGLFQNLWTSLPGLLDDAKTSLEETRVAAKVRLQAAEKRESRLASDRPAEMNPASPNATTIAARGIGAVPGAIVCKDYGTVMFLFNQYATYWTESNQDTLTKGQSRLIRGGSTEPPDPSALGCALVAPGILMQQDPSSIVPVVTVKFSDGTYLKGVTMPQMIVAPNLR